MSNSQGYDVGRWLPPDQAAADDFVRYSADFPDAYFRDGVQLVCGRAEAFLTEDAKSAQLAEYLDTRLERGVPTSALRLSDGEGNVLFAEEAGYPALRSFVLTKISSMHFGRGNDVALRHADLLLRQMREAVAEADVLGIPDHHRVIRGFQRPPGETDVRAQVGNRKGLAAAIALAENDELRDTVIADAFFSRQLLQHYAAILSKARAIVLVTCHADLIEPIQRLSGVKDVRLIEVPLQSSQMRGAANSHFPDAFERICREIKQQPPGLLFLIGAGPLAKYYCLTAKRSGGIAIDVGAVMDFWAGRSGRGRIQQKTLDEWSIVSR